MGVRANLAATLAIGAFDVVHGFEPGLPSLSSAALLEAETTTAATFLSTERIAVPPRKNQRAKFLARVDALLGTSEAAIERASERFPGDYETIPLGVDTDALRPGGEAKGDRRRARARPERGREGRAPAPADAARLGGRARAHGAAHAPPDDPAVGARPGAHALAREARRAPRHARPRRPIFVPAPGGSARLLLEAKACGCAIADPAGLADQPELAAAAVARLAEDDALRARSGAEARAQALAGGLRPPRRAARADLRRR